MQTAYERVTSKCPAMDIEAEAFLIIASKLLGQIGDQYNPPL